MPMFHITWENLLECQHHCITLLVRDIPGCLNVLADGLSGRHEVIGTMWYLHPRMLRPVFSTRYTPELELFATRHNNNKLAAIVSPTPDPPVVAVNVLSIPWDRGWVYFFPPTSLMQRVLQKLVHLNHAALASNAASTATIFETASARRFQQPPQQVHLFAWRATVFCGSYPLSLPGTAGICNYKWQGYESLCCAKQSSCFCENLT